MADQNETSSLFDDAVEVPSATQSTSNAVSRASVKSANDSNPATTDKTRNNELASLRLQLAELSSELLRLQENTTAEDGAPKPRRNGTFAPEKLRSLLVVSDGSPTYHHLNAPRTPSSPSRHSQKSIPSTPHSARSHLECLPSPASTSDGRSEAANLLRERIRKMQQDSLSGIGNNTSGNDDDGSSSSRIADFSMGEQPSIEQYEQLRLQKSEAEAESALLSAELVALRGRHEEERRKLLKTTEELRRRNEELERRISMHRLEGGKSGLGRGTSCPNVMEDDPDGGKAFGFRVRAFAQRWASPAPNTSRQQDVTPATPEERRELRRDLSVASSCGNSTINTNEDFSQELAPGIGAIDPTALYPEVENAQTSNNEEAMKIIAALEEQLRQSEQRAKILEQRLQIVKESGDAVIRSLNEELADVAEDRARAESAMIKELSVLDSQRRQERDDYERRIQEWVALDADRKIEIEEYQRRIESLLGTVRIMDSEAGGAESSGIDGGRNIAPSQSRDLEAEKKMHKDLIDYIHLLEGKSQGNNKKRISPLISTINGAFDVEFNANPTVADDMIEYYRSRPELKEFTLKSELPRMDYEVLLLDQQTNETLKLTNTDEIRSYFASLEDGNMDEEVELLIRASNQSLLADPLAMLTGEGEGKLVHSGSFHSTVIATECSFKLDLRHEGQRRVKVHCELAICVPSGADNAAGYEGTLTPENSESDQKLERKSATLELARADLAIQFSPSPTSTPSGPLVKYTLLDIKPTISDYGVEGENEAAIQSAVMVLARDRHTHIRYNENDANSISSRSSSVKNRLISRVKQLSSSSDYF